MSASSVVQMNDSVGTSQNGSRKPVARSGTRTMSPELTDLKPTLEPSNATPFSISTGAKPDAGIVTWCQRPHRSQNFMSTISTDRFSTKDFASLKSLNMTGLSPFGAPGRPGSGAADHRTATAAGMPRRSSRSARRPQGRATRRRIVPLARRDASSTRNRAERRAASVSRFGRQPPVKRVQSG